jgi:hypothetical protein
MAYFSGSDDEHRPVQLGSSDMAPKAVQVWILSLILTINIHLIPRLLDCPPTEVSNEALSRWAGWPTNEPAKSNGVSRAMYSMLWGALNWLIASWSADNLATHTTALAAGCAPNTGTMDMTTRSIAALLQPHTSSPYLPIIARVIANLVTGAFSEEELSQALDAQLTSLAISPQAKQDAIPALLGIAKLAKAPLQVYVHGVLILLYDSKSLYMC